MKASEDDVALATGAANEPPVYLSLIPYSSSSLVRVTEGPNSQARASAAIDETSEWKNAETKCLNLDK